MPHKKAKHSTRERERLEKGTDLPPAKDSLRNEAIPKSAARVFNAQIIRDEWKKKRKQEDDGDGVHRPGKKPKTQNIDSRGKGKSSLTIQPGESMQHFNRRVEDDLRPMVKSAMETARSVMRNTVKQERVARTPAKKIKVAKSDLDIDQKLRSGAKEHVVPPIVAHKTRPKEFATADTSAPKRLNDIAQAPPEFKKLPRGASSAISTKKDVLSMSQKLLMEEEREKAIQRYRELKATRQHVHDQAK